MRAISENAYAKINLGLDIIGRRKDGYHLVRMIMQEIGLCDNLRIEETDRPGVFFESDCSVLKPDSSNLAVRAAETVIRLYLPGTGVKIFLEKKIPLASGLAGGSADAAAILNGMNQMFALGLNRGELCRIGLSLGADVPFCICGGTALSEGIGEILTELPPMPDCAILLAVPELSVSTQEIYHLFDVEDRNIHARIDDQLKSLYEGDLPNLAGSMKNVLEDVTGARYPVIGQIRTCMMENGALGARMSGSGPSVFGIFTDEEKARRAEDALRKCLPFVNVCLTAPLNRIH